MHTESPKAEPPKRKRRWIQFSLRSLMMLTLVVGLGMATWLVPLKKRADRQKAAVEAILKDGGLVAYDYQHDASGRSIQNAMPPGPAWLRKLLGDDFFTDVVFAAVKTDTSAEHLDDLPRIQSLHLDKGEITDAALAHVAGLARLDYLDLSGATITDDGLVHLERMANLKKLYLDRTKVTDAGLAHLAGLTGLYWLLLDGTQVSDAGLKNVERFTALDALHLSFTRVTDAGLKHLEKLTSLTSLQLRNTAITGRLRHQTLRPTSRPCSASLPAC